MCVAKNEERQTVLGKNSPEVVAEKRLMRGSDVFLGCGHDDDFPRLTHCPHEDGCAFSLYATILRNIPGLYYYWSRAETGVGNLAARISVDR